MLRRLLLVVIMAMAVFAVSILVGAPFSKVAAAMNSTSPLSTSPIVSNSGTVMSPPVGRWFDYVVVIVMENHSINATYGPSCMGNCTYYNNLANTHGLAESYTKGGVPGSLGDYIALTSGDGSVSCNDSPISGLCGPFNDPNIVDKVEGANLSWKAYMEDYPSSGGSRSSGGCFMDFNQSLGHYASIHNPFVYYKDIVNNTSRCSKITPANSVIPAQACGTAANPGIVETDDLFLNDLNSAGTASNYMFLTPNNIDDTHDCGDVSTSNLYLQRLVPRVLNSTLFRTSRAALFLTFDEPNPFRINNDDLYTVWASRNSTYTKSAFKSTQSYNHFSHLRTVEDNWGFPPFFSSTNDGTATNMGEFLKTLFVSASCGNGTAGKPTTCNATIIGGTPPYTIAWASAGSPSTGSGTSYTTTFATKGTFRINATVTDATAAKASNFAMITVAGQPIVVTIACGTATVGKPVTCTASATGGTTPYTFTWASKGSPATGTGSSYTPAFATKGTQTVNATITDVNGVSKLGQATMSVAAQPIVVTVTCGTATAGKPVTCNALPTGGTAPYTFTWASKGTPATGTGSSYTATFASKGSQTVNATATDLNGVSKPGQATVSVTAQPIVVTVTCGAATAGKPVTCNASATGGTSPYVFSWSAPGGNPTAGSGASFTTIFATKGTYVVNATATDANNLKVSGTASVVVSAQPLTATVTATPTVGTSGQSTTFSGSSSGGTAPYMLSWAFGDGSSVMPGSSVAHTFSTPGNYTVTLTVTDANAIATGQTQLYHVGPTLPIGSSFTRSPATVFVGHTANFTAKASGGVGPYTFSWSFGDNTTGTGVSILHSYSAAPKNYTISLQVTDSKGSTSTVSQRILVWQTPDLDGDGKVTIVDAARVAFAFDAKLGDSNYDPRADLDGDGKIGILDIAVIAFYFDSTGW